MAVGQHQAVGRDDDSGTEPAALTGVAQFRAGLDADHGGADTIGHVDHGIGIGVEQRRVVRAGSFAEACSVARDDAESSTISWSNPAWRISFAGTDGWPPLSAQGRRFRAPFMPTAATQNSSCPRLSRASTS